MYSAWCPSKRCCKYVKVEKTSTGTGGGTETILSFGSDDIAKIVAEDGEEKQCLILGTFYREGADWNFRRDGGKQSAGKVNESSVGPAHFLGKIKEHCNPHGPGIQTNTGQAGTTRQERQETMEQHRIAELQKKENLKTALAELKKQLDANIAQERDEHGSAAAAKLEVEADLKLATEMAKLKQSYQHEHMRLIAQFEALEAHLRSGKFDTACLLLCRPFICQLYRRWPANPGY